MKKTFLVLLVLFISVSSSFAWTRLGMSANGFDEHWNAAEVSNSMSVNINANCDIFMIYGSFSQQNQNSYLVVGAYDSINGLDYYKNVTPNTTFGVTVGETNANTYWGTVEVFMTIYEAWAQVFIEYGNVGS